MRNKISIEKKRLIISVVKWSMNVIRENKTLNEESLKLFKKKITRFIIKQASKKYQMINLTEEFSSKKYLLKRDTNREIFSIGTFLFLYTEKNSASYHIGDKESGLIYPFIKFKKEY